MAAESTGAKAPPGLSVGIPAFDETPSLTRLLDARVSTCSTLDVPWEVLLVDGASPDGTAVLAHRLRDSLSLPNGALRALDGELCSRGYRNLHEVLALSRGLRFRGVPTCLQDPVADEPKLGLRQPWQFFLQVTQLTPARLWCRPGGHTELENRRPRMPVPLPSSQRSV